MVNVQQIRCLYPPPARNFDRTAVHFNETIGQVEPNTQPTLRPVTMPSFLGEHIEQMGQHSRQNPIPCPVRIQRFIVFLTGRDPDLPPFPVYRAALLSSS